MAIINWLSKEESERLFREKTFYNGRYINVFDPYICAQWKLNNKWVKDAYNEWTKHNHKWHSDNVFDLRNQHLARLTFSITKKKLVQKLMNEGKIDTTQQPTAINHLYEPPLCQYMTEHNGHFWLGEVLTIWASTKHDFLGNKQENERLAWDDFFRLEKEIVYEKYHNPEIILKDDTEFERKMKTEHEISAEERYIELFVKGDQPTYISPSGGRPKIENKEDRKDYKRVVIKMSESEYNTFEEAFKKSGARDKKQFILKLCGK